MRRKVSRNHVCAFYHAGNGWYLCKGCGTFSWDAAVMMKRGKIVV
jgi:hypothetical protein